MDSRSVSRVLVFVVAIVVVAVAWDMISDADAPPAPVAPGGAAAEPPPPAPPRRDGQTQAGSAEPRFTIPDDPDAGQPGYLALLARAEARRQLRASAGHTYLNEILATRLDSVLHRWDNRILTPVRVHLGHGAVANYQPSFLDAVRAAFRRWQDAGVAIRFDLGADSINAEVHLRWRVQFDIDRTGQTDLTWDADGHHQSGVVTLATFNQVGQPMSIEEIRIVAMHEVGHLLGLDHSPDSTDLMYPVARVRDLSARDVQSARLLYRLSPGSIR